MRSVILSIATRFLLPLLLITSVLLLLRGHNEVGGGFAGGLVAAVAIALYLFGLDLRAVRRLLPIQPAQLIAMGVGTAGVAGLIGPMLGQPFLTGIWMGHEFDLVGGFKLGTPFLFDVGVYMVAAGSLLLISTMLEEER